MEDAERPNLNSRDVEMLIDVINRAAMKGWEAYYVRRVIEKLNAIAQREEN